MYKSLVCKNIFAQGLDFFSIYVNNVNKLIFKYFLFIEIVKRGNLRINPHLLRRKWYLYDILKFMKPTNHNIVGKMKTNKTSTLIMVNSLNRSKNSLCKLTTWEKLGRD